MKRKTATETPTVTRLVLDLPRHDGPPIVPTEGILPDDVQIFKHMEEVSALAEVLDREISLRYALTGRLGEETNWLSKSLKKLVIGVYSDSLDSAERYFRAFRREACIQTVRRSGR